MLGYPARHSGDEAVPRMLVDHHRDVEPVDMPDVRVPEGEWGKGDWVARKVEPDGPAGSVEAVEVIIQKPEK